MKTYLNMRLCEHQNYGSDIISNNKIVEIENSNKLKGLKGKKITVWKMKVHTYCSCIRKTTLPQCKNLN